MQRRPRVHVPTELEQLLAIEKACSDPQRLARVMGAAGNAEEAVAGIGREFGLSDELAWTVTDQQLMAFTAERLAGLRARIAALTTEGVLPDDPARPQAREVMGWLEIVVYDLAPEESRIGWSGPDDAASHIPFLDAAIRELTNTRNRIVVNEAGQ